MTSLKRTRKGWYVEIDPELINAFNLAYPSKGAKKALTVGAIKQALKMRPILEAERERLRNEGRRPQGDNAEPTGMSQDDKERGGSN